MTRLVELTSDEGTIYIEVDEKVPLPKPKPEDELISLTDEIAVQAAQSFEDVLNGIKPVANAIINKVKSFNEREHLTYAMSINAYSRQQLENRLFVTCYGSIGGHKSTKSLSGKRLN